MCQHLCQSVVEAMTCHLIHLCSDRPLSKPLMANHQCDTEISLNTISVGVKWNIVWRKHFSTSMLSSTHGGHVCLRCHFVGELSLFGACWVMTQSPSSWFKMEISFKISPGICTVASDAIRLSPDFLTMTGYILCREDLWVTTNYETSQRIGNLTFEPWILRVVVIQTLPWLAATIATVTKNLAS